LSGKTGYRTLDVLHQLVVNGVVAEDEARTVYELLQGDDLHNLGGPPWSGGADTAPVDCG
jgi:hypothetical protein